MERTQWFSLVPHEPKLFDPPESIKEYQEGFSERFLYVDIDCFKEDVPVSDLPPLITAIHSTSHDIISDFYKYFIEE